MTGKCPPLPYIFPSADDHTSPYRGLIVNATEGLSAEDPLAVELAQKKRDEWNAYQAHVLPWGETCSKAERRLSKNELRPRWDKLRKQIQRDSGGKMSINEAAIKAHESFSPDKTIDMLDESGMAKTPERTLLEACQLEMQRPSLAGGAGVDAEMEWVSCNLWSDPPELDKAPSRRAINFLIDVRTDPKVRGDFWRNLWSKRLTPGDSRAANKQRKPALRDDAVEQISESSHMEEMLRRLGHDVQKAETDSSGD